MEEELKKKLFTLELQLNIKESELKDTRHDLKKIQGENVEIRSSLREIYNKITESGCIPSLDARLYLSESREIVKLIEKVLDNRL